MPGTPWDAPDNDAPPISPLDTASMPRAEDDAEAFATSPEFHDRTVDGSFTAPAAPHDPPAREPEVPSRLTRPTHSGKHDRR